MIPHERSLVKKMEGRPFVLIGVNSDEPGDELKKLNEDAGVTWRSFRNERGDGKTISDEWNVSAWPTLYIIDHRGNIREADVDTRPEKLDALVEKYVKAAEADKSR